MKDLEGGCVGGEGCVEGYGSCGKKTYIKPKGMVEKLMSVCIKGIPQS